MIPIDRTFVCSLKSSMWEGGSPLTCSIHLSLLSSHNLE